MRFIQSCVLAAGLACATQAAADSLDFTGLAPGNLGGSVSLGGVVIEGTSSLNNESDRYFQTEGGAICAQRGSSDNCKGTMMIRFDEKVKRIKMSSAGYKAGDSGFVQLYRGGTLLGTVGVASNGRIDLSAYRRVTRIKISYSGVEDGLAYGKIEWTPAASGKGRKDEAVARLDTSDSSGAAGRKAERREARAAERREARADGAGGKKSR